MRKHPIVKKMNLLSAKLLLSYLSILVLPLVAIVIIYITAAELMYTVQYERMSSELQKTAMETQLNLQEAANLANHISTMAEVSFLDKDLAQSGEKAGFFQMYSFSKLFPDYTLFNHAIRDVYFFFNGQNYVIRLPAVVPADERSYESIGDVLADDYDTMVRFLGDSYWDSKIIMLNSTDINNKQLGVLQSFPFGSFEKPLGTLLILINEGSLNSRLSSNLIGGEGLVVMLGAEGELVKAFAGEKNVLDPAALDFEALSKEQQSTVKLQGLEYAVCCETNSSGGYSFYNIIPKKALVQRIGYIKAVIAGLSALSVIAGLLVCVILWSRRRSLVFRYSKYTNEFGSVKEKESNLWDGLHAILDSVAQLQATAKLQSGLVSSGVINNLLKGEYVSREKLISDMETAGIQLKGSRYLVAVVTFNRGFRAGAEISVNEFRLSMIELVKSMLDMPNYCCEPEDLHIALIIPLSAQNDADKVMRQLCTMEDLLITEENIEAYIGLGSSVDDVIKINESYSQARSVCEYLRFYNIRSVMPFSAMPTSHDSFYFPLEMELRLIWAVEQGKQTELQEVFSQLAVENFAMRRLTFATNKRLLEIVRLTVLRAFRQPGPWQTPGEENCMPVSSKAAGAAGADGGSLAFMEALSRADSLEQIYVILEEHMPFVAKYGTQVENDKNDARRKEIRLWLEKCYCRENLTISEAAAKFGTSESKFYKEFKQLFGLSFSEALEKLRIEKACLLLSEQTLVKNVAALVGYSSDYSFRRAFKRVVGITPSAYMESPGNLSQIK